MSSPVDSEARFAVQIENLSQLELQRLQILLEKFLPQVVMTLLETASTQEWYHRLMAGEVTAMENVPSVLPVINWAEIIDYLQTKVSFPEGTRPVSIISGILNALHRNEWLNDDDSIKPAILKLLVQDLSWENFDLKLMDAFPDNRFMMRTLGRVKFYLIREAVRQVMLQKLGTNPNQDA